MSDLLELSTVPKLTGAKNFHLWRSFITMHYDPSNLNSMIAAQDINVRNLILATIDVTIAQNLVELGSAMKMWDALHAVYDGAATRINHQDKLRALNKMEPPRFETFDSFMWAFVGEVQKLNNAGCGVSESQAMSTLLSKLSSRTAGTDVYLIDSDSKHKTLLEMIGFLNTNYNGVLSQAFGWKE
ncbi:uncharacterized protein LTHEOB_3053 [Lasiodiplodia theobromae]|uniref:uncharacterized protein n=1 Tax=Lasiodiplodia theobromae TaxID=45133 RepID=UPI0015C40296|nr:uncharacterized protein LTHEOB_3053 [Lasiodiplodia theobromae]KAF4534245.1 hypothetical protein LTHEOB_3053 [Lasiodiplodia theobromae]